MAATTIAMLAASACSMINAITTAVTATTAATTPTIIYSALRPDLKGSRPADPDGLAPPVDPLGMPHAISGPNRVRPTTPHGVGKGLPHLARQLISAHT